MPLITIVIAILLILVGLIGYFAGGMASVTALIPAFLGVVLLVLGVLAKKPNLRKHMMHAAVALALLGAIAAGHRLIGAIGSEGENYGLKIFSMGGMTLLCLILLILGIKSFIDARRNRAA
jgi:peptidoglycan/LPS O-acetylase OafA/YrhL